MEDTYNCESCKHSCFNTLLDKESIAIVNKNKSAIEFKQGESIIKQGSFVSQLIYLRHGIVKIVLEGKNDRDSILDFVEENNFLGVAAIGNMDKYPFSVIAVSDCQVCCIKKDTIIDILSNNTKASKQLNSFFFDDYCFMFHKYSVISTRNSHGKLAASISHLSSSTFNKNLLNLISRKDLADHANISLESANKILLQLKNDGIIDIDKNYINIKRRDLIEKLSTVG